ncbi:ORF-31 [Buzura suppressaria nucleopolyhedrovirus]|uniref:ORF-31 n=1 Tax=Buzura suppressaria nuclear polyhedrosis virus TaxID=74320 RepID=W5VKC2_NPVBS|nr:ORF-31 [Buzura suppressaria nucleopolyhedrovirus]AHH82620.1 ORF-31 [Buzura suppressaria nucleopolyhedrovirus]AKN91001.1 ORF-31 [Buzura suppressaria nucleopolyhedrovirus]QYF10603.1 hypothetical protein [Buzura suppressaria nucleopolyhedrovirus]
MTTLQIDDIVTVTILKTRLYKLHLVHVHNTDIYNAILIANGKFNAIYYNNQILRAKVLRIDRTFIDLIPLE